MLPYSARIWSRPLLPDLYASGVQYCPKYAVRLNIRSYEWGKQSFITPPHITANEALCVSHSELNLRLSRSA